MFAQYAALRCMGVAGNAPTIAQRIPMTGLQHNVGATLAVAHLQRGGGCCAMCVCVVGANLRVCPVCGDIRNTNVGALPATPIRHATHNMRRCVAVQPSLHRGKHHRKRADTQVCPYAHGYDDRPSG
ncbi:MAG: hypothetical protein LBQ76_07300 [Candidatus Fibromonas sp.]|nr:hypothetical protein [Candidatus Fibromonas sp.]